MAHANLGHAVQYIARRPTPTDPFWAYIGPKNWNDAFAMLGVRFEREALTIAERLRARYMVTMPSARPDTIEGQLHLADGVGSDSNARLERFRLITEGPRGGRPLNAIFDKRATSDVPYKLFEIVAGAILEARTSPGGEVVAEVDLRTPTGREFTYSATVRADEEGLARLRVPYATQL